MDLWLRYRKATSLQWDYRINIASAAEWREVIYNPYIISSILWPVAPRFLIPGDYVTRRHPHEMNYQHDHNRNKSYREGAKILASQLKIKIKIKGLKVLVYAPLRGALPIWQAVSQFLHGYNITVYYPVTSSFVHYPKEFGILNSKGKIASGRYNNIQEIVRLKPFLKDFDCLLYIDEIISGGMMWGHVKEMIKLRANKHIPCHR